jgi:hypothetical protein
MYRLSFGIEENSTIKRDQYGNILSKLIKNRFVIYQFPINIPLECDEYNNVTGNEFLIIFTDYLKTVGIEIPCYKNKEMYSTLEHYKLDTYFASKNNKHIITDDFASLQPFEDYCIQNNIDITKYWDLLKINNTIYQNNYNMFDSDYEYYEDDYHPVNNYWIVKKRKNCEFISTLDEQLIVSETDPTINTIEDIKNKYQLLNEI